MMIKQCGYCFRILGEDGVYHSIGLTEPVDHLNVAPPKKEDIAVSHGVCAECFQAMVAPEPELPEDGIPAPESVPTKNAGTKTAAISG